MAGGGGWPAPALRMGCADPAGTFSVITLKDGFSLIHTEGKWSYQTLKGRWTPENTRDVNGIVQLNEVVNRLIYNFSCPFSYSNIDWGWIHIGLSLNKFYEDVRSLYVRTGALSLACMAIGLFISIFSPSN